MMLGAYDWAFVKPMRKLHYNMAITLVSIVVAVLIGGIEALGLIGDQLKLSGGFWAAIGEFIETIYNRQRLHSALAYLSPVEFEFKEPRAATQQPGVPMQPSCP